MILDSKKPDAEKAYFSASGFCFSRKLLVPYRAKKLRGAAHWRVGENIAYAATLGASVSQAKGFVLKSEIVRSMEGCQSRICSVNFCSVSRLAYDLFRWYYSRMLLIFVMERGRASFEFFQGAS